MIAQALLASTAIILLSFISEDAATISSALSLFGGPINWPLGFVACFAGIWLGDLGLYSLARCFGKPILKTRWLARFADAAAIARFQIRFNNHASLALLASRFVPGTRLPTYLAAGLLSMPVTQFAAVTGFGALLWIGGIFIIAKLLGSQALTWLSFFQGKIAAIIFVGLVLAATLFAFRRLSYAAVAGVGDSGPPSMFPIETNRGHRPRLQLPAFVRRWTHWEFWPAWLFYTPVGVYYAWLAIRNQLRRTTPQFTAEAFLVDGLTTTDRLLSLHRLCREHEITLPFILKPDVGQRGNGVRVIRSMRTALEYLQTVDAPVIVQRYVTGPCEAGVFYYRFPDKPRGHIFAITEKLFPTITGDGIHTVEEMIRTDYRAALIARTYLRRFASRRDEILAPGEILKLVETGNHAQGCIFRDGMHLHTEALERVIDEISLKVTGFFIGRYDLRYENDEDLKQGRNFQIVELNGASSEATSIYDARNSLLSAYQTLFRQWRLVFAIGAANRT